MKCPNCGKEAINVNGKFVCLDCGVELTSADSNAHNNQDPAPQAQEDTISATLDNQAQAQDQEPATQPEIPENSLGATAAPQPETAAINREETPAVTTPDFPVSEEIKAQEDITKPVEEAFVNELKVSNEPTDTGSYDFTNTEESSTPEVKPEVSEPQSQPIDQVPQAKDVNQVPQPEVPAKDYFQPKSFDIKSESQDEVQQSVDQVTTEIAPESPVEQPVVTSEVNQDQPQPITTPADPVSIPEEVIDTNSEEPQEVQEPVGSGSNLDSLLNQYNNPTSGDYSPNVATTESTTISEQPINNVDNMQTTIPPVNSETEPQSQVGASAIPSIESVFGNDVKNDVTQPNGLNELKSTDNIGKRSKGKLWIIIVAILGGLLLISGVGFGIYYYFNTNNESLNSQVLSDIEASSLSEKVDSAMSSAQSISVSFDENLDFSELKKKRK